MKWAKRIVLWGLMLILSITGVGCAPLGQVLGKDAGPVGDGLVDTAWRLVDLGDQAIMADYEATMIFSEDQVNGVAFCNSYFSPYTRDGTELTLESLVQTEKFCTEPEGLMAQERVFLEALSAAKGYRVEGGTLTLLDDGGHTLLTFAPQRG